MVEIASHGRAAVRMAVDQQRGAHAPAEIDEQHASGPLGPGVPALTDGSGHGVVVEPDGIAGAFSNEVGWMTYPLGEHGEYPARRSYVGAYSFSPDTDKLPGDPAEAWGQQYVDEVIRAGNRKLVPEQATYLPAEESGSTGDAVDDAMSKWMYEPDPGPILPALRKLEQTRNTQAESFSSVASEEEFVAGARRYYQAHDAFWKEDAPDFHAQVFQGFYGRYVLPALDG